MISARFAKWNLIGISIALAILFLSISPSAEASEWQRFFARLHPAYVHAPIGILLFGFILTILKAFGWLKDGDNMINIALVAGSWGALQAIAAGSWLGQLSGYPPDVLFLHKMLGYSVALLSAVLVYVRFNAPKPALVYGGWGVLMLALVIGSDQGGQMTHGEGFVTEYAPEIARNVLGHPDPMNERFELSTPTLTSVYEGIIAPIFTQKCTSCHGEDRDRNRLRLHSPESISNHKGEEPLIVEGHPEESLLIERISLPEGHEDQMPPPLNARPLSHADVELLIWWIAEGASFDALIADVSIPPHIVTILEAYGLSEIRRGIFALDVSSPDSTAVAALRLTGASVDPLTSDSPFLSVRCGLKAQCFSGDELGRLGPHIAWLDLSASAVSDSNLAVLAELPHMTRLDLSGTGIEGAGLSSITDLEFLEYVNLYDTQVSDAALEHLAAVPTLTAVYLWQTAVTPDGVLELRNAIPGARINTGETN